MRHERGSLTPVPPGQLPAGEISPAAGELVGPMNSLSLESYILDSISGGIITVSEGGIITSFNQRAATILGFSAENAKGATLEEVFPNHPANQDFLRIVRRCIDKGDTVARSEVTVETESGEEALIGISISPLLDAQQASLGIVLTFQDLAAVKQAQAQIQRTDQLAALGTFAAGMAHEIRNPLASLQGMAELLQEDVAPDDPKREYLDRIQKNLARLRGLTEDIMNVAHPGEISLEPCEVALVVMDAVELARHENIRKLITLDQEYAEDLPEIYADTEKLERAFLNILKNAYQATPGGGSICVRARRAGQDSPLPGGQPAVLVSCSNTGSFIPEDQKKQLFMPFFTTKDRGVGLGLAITHQIINAHAGHLTVESDEESGTCFKIYLPSEKAHKEEG